MSPLKAEPVLSLSLSPQGLAWSLTYARFITNAYYFLNSDSHALLTWDRDCVRKIVFYSEIKFIIEVMRFRRSRRRETLWGGTRTLSCSPIAESLY